MRLGEPGELCFRGPSSLRGFFNAPDANKRAFTSDGFYRTGDMMTARVIEGETYYAFDEGRLRDNVNRGGEKIGCEEVEAFVSMHPAVVEAKLVPMPDKLYGEKAASSSSFARISAPRRSRSWRIFSSPRGLPSSSVPSASRSLNRFR